MTRKNFARIFAAGLAATLLVHGRASATMPSPAGAITPEVEQAFGRGLFALPGAAAASPHARRTANAATDWFIPVIMVSFSDSTLRYGPATLQPALFDTTHATATGSVADYWDWVSGGRIRVRGEVIGTIVLPHPEEYYANSSYGLNAIMTPCNDWGLVHDAVAAMDPAVDWNRFDRNGDGYVDMVWIIHAGIGAEGSPSRTSLWSVTSTMSGPWSNGGPVETADLIPGNPNRHVRVDRFSMLPEMSLFSPGSPSEIGVYCHEFGHALGLPDLYDTSSLGGAANFGPGCWSIMGTGGYGGDSHTPQSPTHPGAWCLQYLGLTSVVQPAQDTLITIAPLTSGGPVVEYFFQGAYNPEHFLIENRYRQGFDAHLPNDGLVVTQVDDIVMGLGLVNNRVNVGPTPGLRVLEGDGDYDLVRGANRGDANDPLPGALGVTWLDESTAPALRTFGGAPLNLVIDQVQRSGSATRAGLHVRAPGWQANEDLTEAAYAPTMGFSRGRHAAIAANGTEFEVTSDGRSGVSQVMLRSRSFGGAWSASTTVSTGAVGAFDPAIAVLSAEDVALVWTDFRSGSAQVWYRARIGGRWTTETQLSTGGGDSPAIATNAAGKVFATWIAPGTTPRVRLVTFPAASPGGTSVALSDSSNVPSAPSIAATPAGDAWVVWPDRAGSTYAIRFARWTPDSGAILSQAVTQPVVYAQPSADVCADAGGAVHIVWQQVTTGASTVRWQRRPPVGSPSPPESILVTSYDALQEPSIACDAQGGLHVAFERAGATGQKVQYTRWRAGFGWDYAATDVSDGTQGAASRVNVIALTPGDASVLYTETQGGTDHLRTRRRRLDAVPAAVAPAAPAAPAAPGRLRLAPCPLAAGGELAVSGSGIGAGTLVEIFDACGRRVAAARAEGGIARFAPAQTRALAPGLYFTRPAGSFAAGRLVVLR